MINRVEIGHRIPVSSKCLVTRICLLTMRINITPDFGCGIYHLSVATTATLSVGRTCRSRNSMLGSDKRQQQKRRGEWFASLNFSAENFIPGIVIGFVLGLLVDLTKPGVTRSRAGKRVAGGIQGFDCSGTGEELKMVLVVRQDLRMGAGKIASQCAHAATGLYAELMQSQRSLLRQWEQCGQAKIVLTCKNQQEMNRLKHTAESIGLPTFVVADAGRTQVTAGSKTVLAIGPGPKASLDSVTGKLRLL